MAFDQGLAERVPDKYDECLKKDHATEMEFTGRPIKGKDYVQPLNSDQDLRVGTTFVDLFISL